MRHPARGLQRPARRRPLRGLRDARGRADGPLDRRRRLTGYVGILSAELRFPESHSLKEKRHFLRSAKAQLQNRVGASVAEVDYHDVWQRSQLTLSCAAREFREAERLLDEAERYLASREWELGPVRREVVTLDE